MYRSVSLLCRVGHMSQIHGLKREQQPSVFFFFSDFSGRVWCSSFQMTNLKLSFTNDLIKRLPPKGCLSVPIMPKSKSQRSVRQSKYDNTLLLRFLSAALIRRFVAFLNCFFFQHPPALGCCFSFASISWSLIKSVLPSDKTVFSLHFLVAFVLRHFL